MLRLLHIENIAVIEQADILFERGVGTAATVFNPGSLRDGGSYGVVTITNGECSFTWKRVPEF